MREIQEIYMYINLTKVGEGMVEKLVQHGAEVDCKDQARFNLAEFYSY